MVHDIGHELAALPQIAALADLLAQRDASNSNIVGVAPLLAAARPALLAAVARCWAARGGVLLMVVGTSEEALHAANDARLWYEPQHVLLFPAHDTLSYEHMVPSASVLAQRLAVVQRLAAVRAAEPPLLLVAPLKALLQPTLAPHDLASATTHLELNAWLPQERMLRDWLARGYRMVPMVEEPGQMARRGGIVDVWPMAETHPLRIEWFGDEIDSVRGFDAQTQRSERRLERATVGPALEVACWHHREVAARVRALDVTRLRPEVRDEWLSMLERLETGGRFEGWAQLAPFFFEGVLPSLLAHLPPHSSVWLSEAALLERDAAALHRQAEEQRAMLLGAGELVAGFPRPYLIWDELWQQCDALRVAMSSAEPPAAVAAAEADTPAGTWLEPPLFAAANLFGSQVRRFVAEVVGRVRAGERVLIATPQAARFHELVEQALADGALPDEQSERSNGSNGSNGALRGSVQVAHSSLSEGWRMPAQRLTLYTDTEIFGWRQRRALFEQRARPREASADNRATFLRDLRPGEYVVHIEHGIAIFEGMIRRKIDEVERDYLNLRFAGSDRLYVPIDQLDRVARYVGAGDTRPHLTRLGTQEWERAKRTTRAAVQDLAHDLLKLYAQRKVSRGHAFAADNDWQREMEDAFPYVETSDQLRALADVKADMQAGVPMDRLVCGDVGFGKTEVALRAAFKAVQESKQVAVLVPTTVLAQQHYDTFRQRLAAFPITVEMLSRFRSPREQRDIVQRLWHGEVDIVVGTHRMLSRDVLFRDLGLLIIDEEQRFGVRHKERLKHLRTEVDVLTLTATPIPRTLHMALTGIRDMSVIDTPPEDRVPVKTYVVPYSRALLRDAIRRELDRGGQVYVVHNRVSSIYHMAERLRRLVPEASIGVGHGQLAERELEQVMLRFFRGDDDVLLCTTIIENGLDVPTANTIIIDDAPTYGLAQLYQLRGRVGRSARRAYAYLLYHPDHSMTPEAAQRLQAIQEATELGAGFRIAMRDLEIRGAGNMLGEEQSGYIATVGFDLYSRLLEQAVRQIRQQQPPPASSASPAPPQSPTPPLVVDERVLVSPLVTLTLPLSAYLPEAYIEDEVVRVGVYQRMATVQSPEGVAALRRELRDRFGEPPPEAVQLLTWLHVKVLALRAGVSSVMTTEDEVLVRLPEGAPRERLTRRFARDAGVSVGAQFARLNRRVLDGSWSERLIELLEVV